jgi:beta-galactosamide-alpha-2,3-sialyltransferase
MKEVSAFICVTPLQLFIASKIIEVEAITNYVLVNINPHDNIVLRNYYNRLAEGALESNFLIMNSRILGNYLKLKQATNKWKNYKITAIYAASLPNVWVLHIINSYKSAKLYSFDDGSVNLSQLDEYWVVKPLKLTQRIAYFLLRGHMGIDLAYPRIIKHYTIYDGHHNIVEKNRRHYLNLFDVPDTLNEKKDNIKVFLGFVPNEAKYYPAIKWVNPDIYLPHPMEKIRYPDVNYVYTNLIAEHYLLELLQDYNEVELYACASSVLLNIDSPRIHKYVIDLYEGKFDLQNEYNNFAIKMGCEVLPFAYCSSTVVVPAN